MSALEVLGATKRFGETVANKDVNFSIEKGEIHALLGENGAGKSTLVSILTGLYTPDEGKILRAGHEVRFRSPKEALDAGIGVVHQHLNLIENFTIADNVILATHESPLIRERDRDKLGVAAKDFGLKMNPLTPVERLTLGERQQVEIFKLLYRDVDVLFLDEPTTVLTPQEIESLFLKLRELAAEGKSIVIVTHKLDEVMRVADRATIMRQGQVVGTVEIAESSVPELASLMVGKRNTALTQELAPADTSGVTLEVKNLGYDDPDDGAVKNINLELRTGEIVGIAGVAGNGQTLLADVLAGLKPVHEGRIYLDGQDVTVANSQVKRDAGISYIPQDRLATGLCGEFDIPENIYLTRRDWLVFPRKRATQEARKLVEDYDVRYQNLNEPVSRLSGGNIQKILLGRELERGTPVMIVCSPTRGLDIASMRFVQNLLIERRNEGASIILISEELDELKDLADRTLVMYQGTFVHETRREDWDDQIIGQAMAGAVVSEAR